MKIFGSKKLRTTLDNILAQEKLIRELDSLRPVPKKKGIILKFKTWDELEKFTLKRQVDFVEPRI